MIQKSQFLKCRIVPGFANHATHDVSAVRLFRIWRQGLISSKIITETSYLKLTIEAHKPHYKHNLLAWAIQSTQYGLHHNRNIICDLIPFTHNHKYLEIPILIIWSIITWEGKQMLAWNFKFALTLPSYLESIHSPTIEWKLAELPAILDTGVANTTSTPIEWGQADSHEVVGKGHI